MGDSLCSLHQAFTADIVEIVAKDEETQVGKGQVTDGLEWQV